MFHHNKKNYDNTKCWQGYGATGTLWRCWQEGTSLGNSLAIAYKVKNAFNIGPKIYSHIFPLEKEKLLFTQKPLQNVNSSSTHNYPKLETIQESFNRWTNKLWPSYQRILPTNHKEQWIHATTQTNLRGALLSERSQSQEISWSMITSVMTYLKQQDDREEKLSSVCQRSEGQGVGRAEAGRDHKKAAHGRLWEWWNRDLSWLWW